MKNQEGEHEVAFASKKEQGNQICSFSKEANNQFQLPKGELHEVNEHL